MEEKLEQFMTEIRQSRYEVEEKFAALIAELKHEVNSVQQKTSQDLAKKIVNSNYQFKRKGNEYQYNFNCTMEEAMSSAREELAKIKPADPDERAALKKADTKLDEGIKSLIERQKHIKVADRSEFGWATVHYYQDDPLASDSEDEKNLNRVEKEARKEAERLASKRQRGGASGSKRRRAQYQWNEPPGPSHNSSGRREPTVVAPSTGMPQRQRGKEECKNWGHASDVDAQDTSQSIAQVLPDCILYFNLW